MAGLWNAASTKNRAANEATAAQIALLGEKVPFTMAARVFRDAEAQPAAVRATSR